MKKQTETSQVEALNALADNVQELTAAMAALRLPRFPIRDKHGSETGHNAVHEMYVRELEKTAKKYRAALLETESDKERVVKAIYDNVVDPLKRENARFRQWIENEADEQDICTFELFGKICDGCRCPRKDKTK